MPLVNKSLVSCEQEGGGGCFFMLIIHFKMLVCKCAKCKFDIFSM